MKKVLSSWRTERYKTFNWAQYNAALRQRGSLTLWFDPSMQWCTLPHLMDKLNRLEIATTRNKTVTSPDNSLQDREILEELRTLVSITKNYHDDQAREAA